MKTAGLVVIGAAILVIILQAIFGGPTYGGDNDSVVHNSIFVIASFLLGVGATLLLVNMNLTRQRKNKTNTGSTFHDHGKKVR